MKGKSVPTEIKFSAKCVINVLQRMNFVEHVLCHSVDVHQQINDVKRLYYFTSNNTCIFGLNSDIMDLSLGVKAILYDWISDYELVSLSEKIESRLSTLLS